MFRVVTQSPTAQIALIALVAGIMFLPAVSTGVPVGHSYYANHAWLLSFADALSWTNPYPRWLPGMWAGSGSPDFYFYPPLFFYAAAGAQWIGGVGPDQAIAVAGWFFHACAGIGVWLLARSLGLGSAGRVAAALAIMLLPYHLNVFFARNALGEVALFAALGFLLSGLVDMLTKGRGGVRIVLGTAAVLLAHILSVPIVALACLTILFAYRAEGTMHRLLAVIGLGCLGILFAAIYWMPALLLRETVSSDVLLRTHWANQLLLWQNLSQREFLPEVYLPALGLTPFALAACWVGRRDMGHAATFAAVAVAAAWFMMTPASKALWLHTPLPVLQFPWRFMVVAEYGFAIGAGLAVEQLSRRWSVLETGQKMALRLATVVVLGVVGAAHPAWYASNAGAAKAAWVLDARIGVLEWLSWNGRPPGFGFKESMGSQDVLPPLDRVSDVWTMSPGADVEIVSAAPTEITFRVASESVTVVGFRRGFWDYWLLERTTDGETATLDATAPHPLMTATLPAGDAEWRLRLHRPWAEVVGAGISLIAILIALSTPFLFWRRVAVHQPRS